MKRRTRKNYGKRNGNINANLVKEPNFTSFEREDEEVQVVNFTLVKKYGKGKEYINCSAYGEKIEVAKDFKKGDLIHIFGYFKEREYYKMNSLKMGFLFIVPMYLILWEI